MAPIPRFHFPDLVILADTLTGVFPLFLEISMFAKKLSVLAALVAGSVSSAFAAVPAEVTSALTDMKTDAVAVGVVVTVAVVALFAVKFLRKGI